MVRVKIPTVLRKYTGEQAVVETSEGTLSDVLESIEASHAGFKDQIIAADGGLHRFINVYINDEDVRFLDGLNTRIGDDDTVSLLPAVAGG